MPRPCRARFLRCLLGARAEKRRKENMKKTIFAIATDAHFWIPVGVLAGGVCLLMVLR